MLLGAWQGPSAIWPTPPWPTRPAPSRWSSAERLRQVRRIAGDDAAFSEPARARPVEDHDARPDLGGRPAVQARAARTRSTRPAAISSHELIEMQRREIAALIEDGISYIQLDSLHYVERVADTTIRAADDRRGRRSRRLPGHADRGRQRRAGGRAPRRPDGRAAHVPGQQPQRLARRGQLRADRREGVQPARRRSLPAGIRHRPRRRLRAAAVRAGEQDGRARPDQLQAAGPGANRRCCVAASTRPPSTCRSSAWRSRRSAASPRRCWATC